jgi:DNA-binding winged helix-turn-helix (wHTH) protein
LRIKHSTPTGASFVEVPSCFQVQPQAFDLLVFLIRNRDHVASREDLVTAVWEAAISESAIATGINAARRAIGDTGEQQTFIRTVSRRGIRFVGRFVNPRDCILIKTEVGSTPSDQ